MSDLIHFECPQCRKSLSAKPQHIGRSTKCPGCECLVKVPSPEVETVDFVELEEVAEPTAPPSQSNLGEASSRPVPREKAFTPPTPSFEKPPPAIPGTGLGSQPVVYAMPQQASWPAYPFAFPPSTPPPPVPPQYQAIPRNYTPDGFRALSTWFVWLVFISIVGPLVLIVLYLLGSLASPFSHDLVTDTIERRHPAIPDLGPNPFSMPELEDPDMEAELPAPPAAELPAPPQRQEIFYNILIVGVFLTTLSGIVATVLQFILLYRCWRLIQDGKARTTPAKAVWFFAIPFFNFYWWYVAYVGLAEDMNHYCDERRIPEPRIDEEQAVAMYVLSLWGLIPGVNLITGLVALLLLISQVQQWTDVAVAILEARPNRFAA